MSEKNAAKDGETGDFLQKLLAQEIQSRHKVEAELESTRQKLQRLEIIASQTLHAVIVTNPAGEIEWTNQAFTDLTEFTQNEVIGRRPGDLLQGEETDADIVVQIRESLRMQNPIDVEIVNYNRSGKAYWGHLKIVPIWNDDGALTNFVGTQTDITQNKQQARLLDGSEQIYRDLFATSRDAIMSLHDSRFFDCNEAALKLFGYETRKEFCELHPSDVSPEFQPDGRLSSEASRAMVRRALESGNCCFEWRHRKRDGTEFEAEVLLSRYQFEAGQVIQASVRDISARKAAQAVLIDAKQDAEDANQAKSDFLANMSHEIRTPLNVILGFTDALLRADYSIEKQREFLGLIRNSGGHLLHLVNEVLDLSKVEAGKMEFNCERCSIWDIVQDVVASLKVQAARKNLSLSVVATTHLPATIDSDKVRVKQLLTNLIGNAVKFTASGGVTVAVSFVDSVEAAGINDKSEASLILDVHDTGTGIAKENLERIFEPFNQADNSITRQFGGSGLGLAVSKRIVEGLGGTIEAESKQGIGSKFRVTLPTGCLKNEPFAKHADPEISLAADRPDKPTGQRVNHSIRAFTNGAKLATTNAHVLLCEDGDTNRQLVEMVLREAGLTVTSAANGRLGIDVIADQRDVFDLVLMDMQMPVMDGYTAVTKLRSGGYRRPIIALTAHAMQGDRQKCLAAGCNDYVLKPIDFNQLLLTIYDCLRVNAGDPESSHLPDTSMHSDASRDSSGDSSRDEGDYRRTEKIASTLPLDLPYQSIVVQFIGQFPERLHQIQNAINDGEWEKVEKHGHTLRGSGGTIGFDCFTIPAELLERAAQAGDRQAAQGQLDFIKSLSQRLVPSLASESAAGG